MNGQLKIKKNILNKCKYDYFKCMFLLGLAEQAIEFHCCNPMHSHLQSNFIIPWIQYSTFLKKKNINPPIRMGGLIFFYIPPIAIYICKAWKVCQLDYEKYVCVALYQRTWYETKLLFVICLVFAMVNLSFQTVPWSSACIFYY